MPKKLDLIGLRFGRGIVTANLGRRDIAKGKYHPYFRLKCDCGQEYEASYYHLRDGKILSCGCLARELCGNRSRTHGLSKTKTYKSWSDMIQRCTNPKDTHYPEWGGRGITVCPEWFKFEAFFADMGEKPPGLIFDKIDNNGNYHKANCHYCTDKESRRNKQQSIIFTVKGITACLIDLCDHFGMTKHYVRVWTRIQRGWTAEKALLTPVFRNWRKQSHEFKTVK